jgi:hypothetical protein
MISNFDFLIGRFDGRLAVPVAEVAPVLSLVYSTIRNQISEGDPTIPILKICGKNLVILTDLAAWLDAQSKQSSSAIAAVSLLEQFENIKAAPTVVKRGRGRPRKAMGV